MTIASTISMMRRVAREATVETIQGYFEPLAWIARKFAGLVRPSRQPEGHTWSEKVFYADANLTRDFILDVLKGMPPRETRALMLYYGLVPGSENVRVAEIASMTGLSVDEIRRLVEMVFEKIRHYPNAEMILPGRLAWRRWG